MTAAQRLATADLELAGLLEQGWTLVDRWQVDETNTSYEWDEARRTQKPVTRTVARWRYLVAKPSEDVIAELAARVAKAEADQRGAQFLAEAEKKAAEQARERAEQLKTDLESWRASAAARGEQLLVKDERLRKFEGDISKLRAALGELRMREILGEPSK